MFPDDFRLATIPGYELGDLIGRGGMGVVYKARDLENGEEVAIKFILPKFAPDPAFRERFTEEGRRASKVDHPNVVRVRKADEHDGHLFLVMDYVKGNSLEYFITRGSVFAPKRAFEIIKELAAALDEIHVNGIIHNDVTPRNILLTGEGDPKALLTDFGLARQTTSALTGSPEDVFTNPRSGTPGYMAPEQESGERTDQRGDIYALGSVLYFMLFGKPAPRELRSGACRKYPITPKALERVICRALSENPAERYQSAGDFARCLREVAARYPEWSRAKRRGSRWRAISIAAGAMAVAFTGGFVLHPGSQDNGGRIQNRPSSNPASSPIGLPSGQRAPWDNPRLKANEVSSTLLREWRHAKNRNECAPIAPSDLGEGRGAKARSAFFDGGWAITYVHPRGNFTIGGTGEPAESKIDPKDPMTFQTQWRDGSLASYGTQGGENRYVSGQDATTYLANVSIKGQDCLYNITSNLGKSHLEYLLNHIRFVNVPPPE